MPRKQKLASIPSEEAPVLQTESKWKSPRVIAFIVIVVGLIALFLTNKGLLLAAIVNGRPIFRWELNNLLVSRFGAQTLEQMISERLIADAASKEGASVTQEEIDSEVGKITSDLGEAGQLDELLAMQGMTRPEFEKQIRLQLLIRDLLGIDIAITETDIDGFIATNRALLVATEQGALREEAREAIFDSKISEKLQVWFENLRQGAQVTRFIQ